MRPRDTSGSLHSALNQREAGSSKGTQTSDQSPLVPQNRRDVPEGLVANPGRTGERAVGAALSGAQRLGQQESNE